MINPASITNFDLDYNKLQEVLLFWICAAGKNAHTAAKGLDKLLGKSKNPFKKIRSMKNLPKALKRNGIGCYNRKAKTIIELANSKLNLKTCSRDDLIKIYGIGMKTASCFIIHSRKDANYAGLDTHILKYLKQKGYDVPTSTPSRKKYLQVEQKFLELVKRSGKSVAEFDLDIWRKYSNNNI